MESTTMPNALRRLLIIFGALLIVSLLASGANIYITLAAPRQAVTVPNRVGFEGRLADSNGDPAEGSYTLTFSLYSLAEGGDPVWSEVQSTVPVHNGLYSVQLGANISLQPSTFDGPRWLGVKVGDDAEMTPRVPISSVPFALNAAQASGLQGRSVSANAPQDGQALLWSASGSQWQPGAIEVPDNFEYPRRASGWHFDSTAVTGGPIEHVLIPQQIFGDQSYVVPGANGNAFTTSFMLQAGTSYTFYVLGITSYNRGKLDWYVDDVLQPQISGQDWYSPATVYNVIMSGSVTVVGDGYHVLKGVVNGKNASSTSYGMGLTRWWIKPATD